MTQPNDILDAVLNVLAIAVIVDHKILDTELTEFTRQAVGMSVLCLQSINNSEAEAWFSTNKQSILDAMESKGRNTVILKALTKIKDAAIRESMYDAMIAISVSDTEFHREESDLVKSASLLWGFQRPPIRVSN